MINFDVPRSEQRKFERELKRYYKKNRKEFEHRVNQATAAIHKMAVDNCARDEGDTRDKIHMDFSDKGMTGAVISPSDHSAALEKGTKPHMPPVGGSKGKPLTEWAKRHNIDPWALAMSIKKKGTQAHPFMYPAWKKAHKDFLKGLRRVFR